MKFSLRNPRFFITLILITTVIMGVLLWRGYSTFNAYTKQNHEMQLHLVMQLSADITRLYRALTLVDTPFDERQQIFERSLFALNARIDSILLSPTVMPTFSATPRVKLAELKAELRAQVDIINALSLSPTEDNLQLAFRLLDDLYRLSNQLLVLYYRESIVFRETQVEQIENSTNLFIMTVILALGLALILIVIQRLTGNRLRQILKQEKELRHQKKVFVDTLETSPVATALVDLTTPNKLIFVNRAFEELTGYNIDNYGHLDNISSPGEDHLPFSELLTQAQKQTISVELRTKNALGVPYIQLLTAKRIETENSDQGLLVIHKRDITEQVQQNKKMEREANYDSLTKIPNRSLGNFSLKRAIRHAKRTSSVLAVLFIDLDDFKLINDTMGHNAGDQLLSLVADRLTERLRSSDLLCRLGGDEFMILLNEVDTEESVASVASNIIEELNRIFKVQDTDVQIGCSIGAAVFPKDGDSAELLMKHADIAMYDAKNNGANQLRFYRPELNERNEREQLLKSKAATALQHEQIQAYFQPIVSLTTNHIIGAEALMRWIDNDGMFISPGEFIPMLERSPLIWDLTRHMLESSLKFATQARRSIDKDFYVSINLSPVLFWHQSTSIAEIIIDSFNKRDFEPSMLRVELTESVFIRNYEKVRAEMAKLRTLGIKIMLDDFGTGYSSLSYLQKMPIDVIKIDRSFIHHIVFESKNQAIVRATIEMARSIRCTVVAEGVEELSDVDYLKRLNCDFYQGFYCSPAIPCEQFIAQFAHHETAMNL